MPYPTDTTEEIQLDHMGEMDEIQEDTTDLEEKIVQVEMINPREEGYASMKDATESLEE